MKMNTTFLLAALAAIAVAGAAADADAQGVRDIPPVPTALYVLPAIGLLLLITVVVLVIVAVRRLGRRRTPSFGQAVDPSGRKVKSRFFGRGIEDRPVGKYRSFHDRPGDASVPAAGRLFLDSSAALAVMKGSVTPGAGIRERMAVTATARREIDGVSSGGGYGDLPGCQDVPGRGDDFEHYLREFEMIQKKALQDPTGDLAARWMESKQRHIDEKYGVSPVALDLGGTINSKAARYVLSRLFEDAGNDRMIVAEAASLSGTGAAIVSSDGDILVFRREISGMTGGRLGVSRTESLRG